jgi:hypothetical protein
MQNIPAKVDIKSKGQRVLKGSIQYPTKRAGILDFGEAQRRIAPTMVIISKRVNK